MTPRSLGLVLLLALPGCDGPITLERFAPELLSVDVGETEIAVTLHPSFRRNYDCILTSEVIVTMNGNR